MRNVRERLLSGGFCGKTSPFRAYGKFMPRQRDPSVFTTSVSGIPEDAWAAFREEIKRYQKVIDPNYTFRKGLEEAIFNYQAKFNETKSETQAFGLSPFYNRRRLKPLRDKKNEKSIPIQIHNDARDALRDLAYGTGYKQNMILLFAMWSQTERLYKKFYEVEYRRLQHEYARRLKENQQNKDSELTDYDIYFEVFDDLIREHSDYDQRLLDRMTGRTSSGTITHDQDDDKDDVTPTPRKHLPG